jgi:hypothetical protein
MVRPSGVEVLALYRPNFAPYIKLECYEHRSKS